MENNLFKIWNNINNKEQEFILSCLNNKTFSGNPNIDQYLLKYNHNTLKYKFAECSTLFLLY